jgi:hypothetical protein
VCVTATRETACVLAEPREVAKQEPQTPQEACMTVPSLSPAMIVDELYPARGCPRVHWLSEKTATLSGREPEPGAMTA